MKINRTQLLPDRPGIPPMAPLPEAETIDPAALAAAYRNGDIDLICVLGPTASGKTRYAVELAHSLACLYHGLSLDSMVSTTGGSVPSATVATLGHVRGGTADEVGGGAERSEALSEGTLPPA